MAITITREFQSALDSIKAGNNVLITGKAGTGKSTLLRTYLESVKDKKVLVTAPTGVAALNVDGFTIHKSFGFRPGMFPDDIKPGGSYKASSATAELLKSIDILVVDEISMVRADLFDMMNLALQRIRKNPQPFGGVQLVLVGDLLQLPPVVTEREAELFNGHWDSPYFFSAHCYDEVALTSINLTTVWRQTDEEFIEVLNQVREGSLSDAALDRLNQQVDPDFQVPDDWVTLASHRRTVEQINHDRIESLNTKKYFSAAEYQGEQDKNSFSGAEELHYAVGARVMTIVNDSLGAFVNGSFGTITAASDEKITVSLDHTGASVELSKHVWEIKRPTVTEKGIGSVVVGTVRQFPVILAWAITIHKSQGKTIPKLYINLKGGTTTDGQFYVALSRGVSLDNVRFSTPVESRHIRANNSLVRRIRRDVGPKVTTNRVTFLSIDGVSFGMSDHVARIHAIVLEDGKLVADFGSWINPMSDLGSFGERQNIPSGGLAMAPTLSDFWPLLLRQAAGSIVVGDNLPMLERAIRHQEKGMNLGLGTGYDVSEFSISLRSSDVVQRCHEMADHHQYRPFPISHGQVVPPAPLHTEGAVFIPTWAPNSPMVLDLSQATESDRAWAAYSGGPTNDLVAEEVAETADLLSAWAVSRGYWTTAEENEVRTRAARAGMTDLLLPKVETNELDVPSLLIPGTRVAFTGRNNLLGGPADDDRLKEICDNCNLEYKKSMSKSKCDVLVALDVGSQSRKAQAAREYGKPIISQEAFEHWYYHGPFLVEANEPESPVDEPAPTPPSTPLVEQEFIDEESTEDLTWVMPEEILKEGTRVAFRGSTFVQGILLPQGEPLQGLCSILGLEYKQAVTNTRCDVLVTDAPDATDGKMRMAKIHDKPLILQSDFDAWASNRLAEIESEEPLETSFEETEDSDLDLDIDEFDGSDETPAEGIPAREEICRFDAPTQDYATYLARKEEAEQRWSNSTPQPSSSYLPHPAPPISTHAPVRTTPASRVLERPKTKKALIGTGISAAAAVVLFITAATLIITETAEALQVITLLTSIVAAFATVVFGVVTVINRILSK